MMKRFLALLAVVMMGVSVGAQATRVVRVTSEAFTESEILAQMVRLMLESEGIPTESNMRFGYTEANRNSLLNGFSDVYVEYTGTALFNFFSDVAWFDLERVNTRDPLAIYATVAQLDAVLYNHIWLQPAPASNAYGVVVSRAFADAHNLRTMSDFAAYVNANNGGDVLLVSDETFASSPDAFPRFEERYGFDLNAQNLFVIAGATNAMAQEAVSRNVNGINAGMAFTTDALISQYDLVLLEDDQDAQPFFQPAPVFRKEILDAYPQVIGLLNPVFASLTDDVLRALNKRVDVDGLPAEAVARAYLQENGFLGE
jgi:osmoprotectant transport system substrate-binding protein